MYKADLSVQWYTYCKDWFALRSFVHNFKNWPIVPVWYVTEVHHWSWEVRHCSVWKCKAWQKNEATLSQKVCVMIRSLGHDLASLSRVKQAQMELIHSHRSTDWIAVRRARRIADFILWSAGRVAVHCRTALFRVPLQLTFCLVFLTSGPLNLRSSLPSWTGCLFYLNSRRHGKEEPFRVLHMVTQLHDRTNLCENVWDICCSR